MFTCKIDPTNQPVHTCHWLTTGAGTSNLHTSVAKCVDCNHITQPNSDAKVVAYSPEAHCALLAL